MAMAEGERTECAEPPRDEPPADGALKRAEELHKLSRISKILVFLVNYIP